MNVLIKSFHFFLFQSGPQKARLLSSIRKAIKSRSSISRAYSMRETRTSVAVETEADSEDLSKAWAKKVSGLGTNQGGVWVKMDVAQTGQTDRQTQVCRPIN